MEYSLWYKLLYTAHKESFSSGLTLPFIIGAMGDKHYECPIEGFVDEIAVSNYEERVAILMSPDVDELVFKLVSRKYKFSSGTDLDDIHIANSVNFIGQDTTDLIHFFEDKFSDQLVKQELSKNPATHKWSGFTVADNVFIKRASEVKIEY